MYLHSKNQFDDLNKHSNQIISIKHIPLETRKSWVLAHLQIILVSKQFSDILTVILNHCWSIAHLSSSSLTFPMINHRQSHAHLQADPLVEASQVGTSHCFRSPSTCWDQDGSQRSPSMVQCIYTHIQYLWLRIKGWLEAKICDSNLGEEVINHTD